MIIGRGAPRYQSLAAIYPRSKELQGNLCEYFIVVVRLCHHILKFTQKSTVMQFTSTLTTSSLDSFQPELEIWATAIKEEVNILMAKTSEDEADKNSKFRDWSLSFRTLESHQKQLAATRRVLDLCSRYDYQVKWKQTRKIGNTTVFQSDDKYQSWKELQGSATLIYTGRLGSGKSVLMANIVDDLNLNVQNNNSAVAYFFCRHDEAESLETKTIIGSLARQLLVAFKTSALDLKRFDENELKDVGGLIRMLDTALPLKHRAIFVLDGLDECDHSVAKEVILYLRTMQETFNLHLCVSLRLDPNKLLRYSPEQFVQCSVTSIPVENPDIEFFIQRELENRIQSNELIIGNPELILEIRDSLVAGSQGMFLWVALQIDILCTMKTDVDIHQALANIPKDLSNTFTRILKKHYEPTTKPDQRTILEIIAMAQRPLTSEELREVLSVSPGDSTWDPGKLINDVKSVLACCGSLVTIDEEDSTVQLIHHSVKQFLIEEYCDSSGADFDIDDANLSMARLILTYLSYDHFDRQLSTSVVPRIDVGDTPYNIVKSTVVSHSSVQNVALGLLRLKKTRRSQDIGRTIQAMNPRQHVSRGYVFHFLSYARLYWIHHLCATSASDILELSLLEKTLERRVLSVDEALPYSKSSAGHERRVRFEIRIYASKVVADSHNTSSDRRSRRGRALLFCACGLNDSSLLRRLIQVDRLDLNQLNSYGRTPILHAALHGYRNAVQELICTKNINLNSRDTSGCTPLIWAARGNFLLVVRDLLHTLGNQPPVLRPDGIPSLMYDGRSIDVNSVDLQKCTALSYAAQNGSSECVLLLLQFGADPQLADDMGRTPLIYAAMSRKASTVKALYDYPSRTYYFNTPDIKDVEGRTALSYAAQRGTFDIVRTLLSDQRSDPDSQDHKGRSPLSYAAQYGTLDIVDALLANIHVDADSKCDGGLSPLSWAIERKVPSAKGNDVPSKEEDTQCSIVRAFLDTGRVDINSRDNAGRTPLIRAVFHQRYSIVALLLEYACDIHIQDNGGQTALVWAQWSGNQKILQLLREYTPGTAGKKIYTSYGHLTHRFND
jgi:ankyrin repeat protein